ncbi:N-acetyltransferase [Rhizodiscina lignyota]|uniref:N-acetyltransferase n=1 Tax=Rhizodiscina lignyota TaxID=1504668 RepID=A0A9P4IIX3_9PEZI|nr:N-acetyltransferase [Rhizodiscina lignyota]
MGDASFMISPARSAKDIEDVAQLFTAYAEWIALDLGFQDFATELASLPGKYSPARGGELLIARRTGGEAVGCMAVRWLGSDECCEAKRLYTTPSGRGLGIGRALIAAAFDAARQLGYREMKLDTLPRMSAAVSLYKQFGFVDTEPYYDTPLEGTRFLSCNLDQWAASNRLVLQDLLRNRERC